MVARQKQGFIPTYQLGDYFCDMPEKKPEIDIINELLEDCLMAFPVSSLMISLYQQYQKRGFLTKKQMQGLHIKASQVATINKGRLATLEAMIKKMPNRFKSELPATQTEPGPDTKTQEMIEEILAHFPEHKRVLFLKSKLSGKEAITSREIEELKKFRKMLDK